MKRFIKRLINNKLKITRNTVLFLIGIAGIIHEVFLTSLDRPDVLILFTAMIGLPAFLKGDELKMMRGEKVTPNDSSQPADARNKAKAPKSYYQNKHYDDLDQG